MRVFTRYDPPFYCVWVSCRAVATERVLAQEDGGEELTLGRFCWEHADKAVELFSKEVARGAARK